jgi:phosphoribosylformylglycinamidine cyclo-ligase
MAHITGGGLPGNLSRAMPSSLDAVVETSSWEIPAVFTALENAAHIPPAEMFRVFNMGVGMVVIAAPSEADEIIGSARVAGVVGWVLGHVKPGSGKVVIV